MIYKTKSILSQKSMMASPPAQYLQPLAFVHPPRRKKVAWNIWLKFHQCRDTGVIFSCQMTTDPGLSVMWYSHWWKQSLCFPITAAQSQYQWPHQLIKNTLIKRFLPRLGLNHTARFPLISKALTPITQGNKGRSIHFCGNYWPFPYKNRNISVLIHVMLTL